MRGRRVSPTLRTELLAQLCHAGRSLEPEERRLGERQRLRPLAERSVRRERPAPADVVRACERDALDGRQVEGLQLADRERAHVRELPARGEVEDGRPLFGALCAVCAVCRRVKDPQEPLEVDAQDPGEVQRILVA